MAQDKNIEKRLVPDFSADGTKESYDKPNLGSISVALVQAGGADKMPALDFRTYGVKER